MSSTIFARGSRCSCFSSTITLVLQLRCPKTSPLLLVGFWSLFYVICSILSRLVCLNAGLFYWPSPGVSLGKAAVLSVSGDSDAPLGSWAGAELTALPPHRYPPSSLQQLQQSDGELRLYKERRDEEEDARRVGQQGREGRERSHWLSEFAPTWLQQLGIFHDENGHKRTQKHQEQGQRDLQEKWSPEQKQRNLLQQQLRRRRTNQSLLFLEEQQKSTPQEQKTNRYFQKQLENSTVEHEDQTPENAAYIQSMGRPAAQHDQQQQEQEHGILLQPRRAFPAPHHNHSFVAYPHNSYRTYGHVVSRHSTASIRPVPLSSKKEDRPFAACKRSSTRSALLETQRSYDENAEHSIRSLHVPLYHPTLAGTNGEKADDGAPAFGKGREGEILLETQGQSTGIGTILAGAGLSTLLGGLSQYQQGPLAAGPPGSSVPALAGAPATAAVTPAALPGVTSAGLTAVPTVATAAVPAGATGAELNPLTLGGMGPTPESSGHNVLPITVGIILGLVLMCLVGGCIFRKMKKKRRR